ncbi:hypothetical protein J22TS1_01840 [Siminovitchia terrae]|uniref:hypothetical protein n=1 Tax=Siminovitchia terrae TaxID=1914933 RepID=UPI001B16D2B9|nr:hypothetical protein [Siminovitchia terrae]GIN89133.1 hypothetical protein J22TS1_01840 [Siminovitchia terrae]
MNLSEWIQLSIAIFTAFAAFSAAISVRRSNQDRKYAYKPQFEIITDEDDNFVINIANFNPQYQSYEMIKVLNRESMKELDYEKQLTQLSSIINILKIKFPKSDRVENEDNTIVIKFRSIIGDVYIEKVSIPIDGNKNISSAIKGKVFK